MDVHVDRMEGLGDARTARIHEGCVPAYAEAALETLYECPMSTLLRFRQYYSMDDVTTYVSSDGRVPRAVIVFRVEGDGLRVYNEQITIPARELEGFARTAFAHYPRLRRISLYAVDACTDGLVFPHQKLRCLEDITLPLPESLARYDAMLSKNMSLKIKRSNKKLLSDFASVRTHVAGPREAGADLVERIIGFNRMRMAVKGQACYHNDGETAKLVEMVERFGLVCTVSLDGELGAGMIMLRIGATISMHTIAHHPRYDKYNLGTLCCYYGIAHAIETGARRFGFGWGRNEYKYRLLGEHKDLHRIDIYRTPLAMASDLPTLCRHRLHARRRDFKQWMAHPGPGDGEVAKGLRRTLHAVRALRDSFH